MEIRFASAKLKKEFESQALLQKRYGEQANKIQLRLALLKASPNLASVPKGKPDRCHELKGERKGTFAVDLIHPFRLLFEPSGNPVPSMEKVTSIRILGVEDYH